MAFEVKETPLETHLRSANSLAKNFGIEKVYVIGRQVAQDFPGLVWGGFVQ